MLKEVDHPISPKHGCVKISFFDEDDKKGRKVNAWFPDRGWWFGSGAILEVKIFDEKKLGPTIFWMDFLRLLRHDFSIYDRKYRLVEHVLSQSKRSWSYPILNLLPLAYDLNDCLGKSDLCAVSNSRRYRENHRSALSRICRDESLMQAIRQEFWKRK